MAFWQEFGVICGGILAFLGIVSIVGRAMWRIWLRVDERLDAIDGKLDAHLEWHDPRELPIVPRWKNERMRRDYRDYP